MGVVKVSTYAVVILDLVFVKTNGEFAYCKLSLSAQPVSAVKAFVR